MRILITGSRDWPDKEKVAYEIEMAIDEYVKADPPPEGTRYAEEITVIHGACEYGGADIMAAEWAAHKEYLIEAYAVTEANKRMNGARAYFLRNKAMVDAGADVCLAFNKDHSRGTEMTIKLARAAGIIVKEFVL